MMIDVGNRNYSFDLNPLRFVNCVELERNERNPDSFHAADRASCAWMCDVSYQMQSACLVFVCFEKRLIDCIRWEFSFMLESPLKISINRIFPQKRNKIASAGTRLASSKTEKFRMKSYRCYRSRIVRFPSDPMLFTTAGKFFHFRLKFLKTQTKPDRNILRSVL